MPRSEQRTNTTRYLRSRPDLGNSLVEHNSVLAAYPDLGSSFNATPHFSHTYPDLGRDSAPLQPDLVERGSAGESVESELEGENRGFEPPRSEERFLEVA